MSRVWFNGRIVPEREVRISPYDHGLLVGDGVFETLCADAGRIFALRRHHERLCRGGEALGLAIPPRDSLRAAAEDVIRANGLGQGRARLRITVTGGPAPLGSDQGSEGPTVLVAAAPAPVWDRAAVVVTVPFTRNERGALAGLKTTSYAENVLALRLAKARGASEALFANTRSELCEGTGSNVFLVRGPEVWTPPLDSGCLAGVTRALVLEICRREGLPIREESIPFAELPEVEEAFLTSTTREVQAIGQIDGRALPVVEGAVTRRLAKRFRAWAAADADP